MNLKCPFCNFVWDYDESGMVPSPEWGSERETHCPACKKFFAFELIQILEPINETATEINRVCQNCRFWNQIDGQHKALTPKDFGTCLNVKTDAFENDEPSGIMVVENNPWFGKDFGCIHFEKKD